MNYGWEDVKDSHQNFHRNCVVFHLLGELTRSVIAVRVKIRYTKRRVVADQEVKGKIHNIEGV